MSRSSRNFSFIDREVQGALLVRAAFYWLFCLFTITLMLVCWNAYQGPPRRFADLFLDLFYRYGPALLASLALLPVVLIDVIRTSNRFVGPISRLRCALSDLAEGRPVQPLNFRDNDQWRDLAADFNRAIGRVVRDAVERGSATEEMSEAERARLTASN